MRKVDVVIIGGGAAGMSAAINLYDSNVKNLLIIERNHKLGGILNQCIHTGFGLEYFKEDLTGPEYASKLRAQVGSKKIPYMLNSSVVNLTAEKILTVSSKLNGVEQMQARAVLIATGCRERTRENIQVAGTRPAGVFTAGQAQNLININNYKIGNKVIIQGSGDIGLIMARRLSIEGYKVVKVLERDRFLYGLIRNKVQCLDDYGIPIDFNKEIVEIKGKNRVTGVSVYDLDNKTYEDYECDTVLFAVGLIPELELAKKAGVSLVDNFSPCVNAGYETSVSGVFVCGNSLHIHDLVDSVSVEAETVSEKISEYISDENGFKTRVDKSKSIEWKNTEKNYDKTFFEKNHDKKVCIVCPKSCLIDEETYGCKAGLEYLRTESESKPRTFTTTINKMPVRTKGQVALSDFYNLKSLLKNMGDLDKDSFVVNYEQQKIEFNAILD